MNIKKIFAGSDQVLINYINSFQLLEIKKTLLFNAEIFEKAQKCKMDYLEIYFIVFVIFGMLQHLNSKQLKLSAAQQTKLKDVHASSI